MFPVVRAGQQAGRRVFVYPLWFKMGVAVVLQQDCVKQQAKRAKSANPSVCIRGVLS